MNKAYLAKIIAKDSQGLQLISACCSRAKVKVNEIEVAKEKVSFKLPKILNWQMAVYTKLSEENLKEFFLKYNLGKLF